MENSEKKQFFKKKVEINGLFKKYYQEVLSLHDVEFKLMIEKFTEKLPITFRINKMNPYYEFVESDLQKLIENTEKTCKIKLLEWYPLNNLYIIENYDKKNPNNKGVRDFLSRENEYGIFRQELVSMVPVSLVSISHSDTVIDFCSAPGNKTIQILELMYNQAQLNGDLPSGLVISNEIDQKRASMLVHFIQKLPTVNLIVTNQNAEEFPVSENLKPDFVFCDVPCSGDGTLRKNKGLRTRWKLSYGYQNHVIQSKILENAVKIAKDGGLIVYSTCSINPIENEAVVANILEKYKGNVELVEIQEKFNLSLKCTEGLVKWKVCYDWDNENDLKFAQQFKEIGKKNKHIIKESMFHEIYTDKNHNNKIFISDPLNLRRCLRFYPHQNNSGGFFVAIIRKTSSINLTPLNHIPLSNKIKEKTIGDDLDEFIKMVSKSDKDLAEKLEEVKLPEKEKEIENATKFEFNFNEFVKFQEYKDNYENLVDYFEIKNKNILDRLYSQRDTSEKIFFYSEKICQMLNELCEMNLKILHCGAHVFEKARGKTGLCKYRINQMGTVLFESLIEKQKIVCEIQFIHKILKEVTLSFDLLTDNEKLLIESIGFGCFIATNGEIAITCRKGNKNIRLMIHENIAKNLLLYVQNYLLQ